MTELSFIKEITKAKSILLNSSV